MSTRLLKPRVGQFGPATIGDKVKSEGSYTLIHLLNLAFWITLELQNFGKPKKLLFENKNFVRKFCSSFNKQFLNLLTQFSRFLKFFLS